MLITKKNIRGLYDVFIPILAIGVYYGYTSTLLCLTAFLVKFLLAGKYERSITLLLFGPAYFGLLFNIFNVSIPGSFFSILCAIILLNNKVFVLIRLFKKNFNYLSLIILIFFVCYLLGPMNEYGQSKMASIVYVGFLTLFSFLIYNNSSKICNRDIGHLAIIISISYLVLAIEFLSFGIPSSLLDFSTFRESSLSLRNAELNTITYHLPAITALYGYAFWLSSARFNSFEKIFLVFFSASSLYVILYSGTRQAIVGFFIIIFIRLVLLSKKRKIINLLISIISIGLISISIFNTKTEYINSIIEGNSIEESLNRNYTRSFEILNDDFIWGVGLGGYFNGVDVKDKYPHNIVLEILCEGGVLMLILILLIIFISLKGSVIFKFLSYNNSFVFIVFIAYSVRALISEDLGENIALISILLSFRRVK